MIRKLVLAFVAVAAVGVLAARSADAAPPISRNNPYRSFNISGINYGSQQWEQFHGRRAYSHAARRGLRFRRR